MSDFLRVEELAKDYPSPEGTYPVFRGLNFDVERGSLASIMGASGVGKTTLLNLLGALDRPSAGKVFLEGEDVFAKDEHDLAVLRNKKIGFVFQFFHLLPEFSAAENVALPLMIGGLGKDEALEKAARVLTDVHLGEKTRSRPAHLSGGEQQRVAIARALVNEPRLLLADEPTGNLDWQAGERILHLISELHRTRNLTSLIVTHNEKVAAFCRHHFLMEGGELKRLPPS
jgi:ABC-type lipoprotein export system ATPase subunit